MSSSAREETHFGYQKVALDDKQALVDDVFHRVAGRYDLMNDVMSLGLHRLWKDLLVAKVRPSRHRAFAQLDVAGGTGDVAFRVAAAGGPLTAVTVVDVNADMLEVGRKRGPRGYDRGSRLCARRFHRPDGRRGRHSLRLEAIDWGPWRISAIAPAWSTPASCWRGKARSFRSTVICCRRCRAPRSPSATFSRAPAPRGSRACRPPSIASAPLM